MRIYVWGTGRLTGKVVGIYLSADSVTAYIDNDRRKSVWQGKPVIHPDALVNGSYDAIIVINLHSQEIYEQCKMLNLDLNKIIYLYQNICGVDLNKNYDLIESIFGKEYTKIVKERYHIVRGVENNGVPSLVNKGTTGGGIGLQIMYESKLSSL